MLISQLRKYVEKTNAVYATYSYFIKTDFVEY